MDAIDQEKQWGATRIKTLKISYEWVIYNYSVSGKKNGDSIKSPKFSSLKYPDYQWRLYLYPKGIEEDFESHVSLYLDLISENPYIELQVEYSILNDKREKINTKEKTHLFLDEDAVGFNDFITINELMDKDKHLVDDNKLTILCNLTAGVGWTNYSSENEVKIEDSLYQVKLSNDLKTFFESQELTDVTLTANDSTEFRAHKVLLAARSKVFLAMLKNEMKEKEENLIKIPDINSDVLSILLHYIYSGEVKNLDEYACELLKCAEKYELFELKKLCENFLANKLSNENALKILLLADCYSCERLKNQVTHFIIAHRIDIMNTAEFKSLKSSNSPIVIDLLTVMALSNPLCS